MLGGRTRERSIPLHSRVLTKDEELGKRDDDFRPRRKTNMQEYLDPTRWRKRRLFALLSICVLLYFFVKNIPTDLGTANSRLNPEYRVSQQPPTERPAPVRPYEVPHSEPTGSPPSLDEADSQELMQRTFTGVIRFYRLAASLNLVSASARDPNLNRNILFAASSLKSLANLLPLACEMAQKQQNWVHFAIMSRSDLSLSDIKTINGISDSCQAIVWHDARPDYMEYSSDARHEAAVTGGVIHLRTHMSPHAIIVDDEVAEDATFSRAMRRKAKDLFLPLIEIPHGDYDNYRFITQLDHISLSHWFSPTIEIVLQAQKESVGSLIRLLRALGAADYKGIRLPKLTLNLAMNIQPALKSFLSSFKWPPRYEPPTRDVDPITVRHQIMSQQATSEQAVLRLVESFYPASHDHHILLLSPQIEVTSQYMLYIQYTILKYKYSVSGKQDARDLLGISLDIPAFDLSGERFISNNETFTYNVPSSSSLLIFGDKWTTFHSYLTLRIAATRSGKATKTKKIVPETEPAWVEYLLELTRARGWTVLYPATNFATVHNELAQIPEEFTKETKSKLASKELDIEEPFLVASVSPVLVEHDEGHLTDPTTPLHNLVSDLADLAGLPHRSHQGQDVQTQDATDEYLQEFRQTVGGCSSAEAKRTRIIQEDSADDLFCLPYIDMLFDTIEESDDAVI